MLSSLITGDIWFSNNPNLDFPEIDENSSASLKLLRATVCKYRESGVSREIFNFFIFCSNNLYSELFSKILLKGPEAL